MNQRMFLSSSFDDVAQLLLNLEEKLEGKRITFIPTASIVESVVFYVEAGRKALEGMGLIVDELEISTAAPEEIENKIKNNDFIYVTGGNTFFLLQEMKRTGADKIIIDEIKAGKLYIGESAGSIITAPNIAYVSAMDQSKSAPELQSYDGLGVVDFYMIPHYTNYPYKKVTHQIVEEYGTALPLQPISNHEAIVIRGQEISIVSTK